MLLKAIVLIKVAAITVGLAYSAWYEMTGNDLGVIAILTG